MAAKKGAHIIERRNGPVRVEGWDFGVPGLFLHHGIVFDEGGKVTMYNKKTFTVTHLASGEHVGVIYHLQGVRETAKYAHWKYHGPDWTVSKAEILANPDIYAAHLFRELA